MILKTKEVCKEWRAKMKAEGQRVKIRKISFMDLAREEVFYGEVLPRKEGQPC
jgi:hypothetical protein